MAKPKDREDPRVTEILGKISRGVSVTGAVLSSGMGHGTWKRLLGESEGLRDRVRAAKAAMEASAIEALDSSGEARWYAWKLERLLPRRYGTRTEPVPPGSQVVLVWPSAVGHLLPPAAAPLPQGPQGMGLPSGLGQIEGIEAELDGADSGADDPGT